MQFRLDRDEVNLLVDVLLEQPAGEYGELFNKVMARDLRFDGSELEETADLLVGKKRSLKDEIARQPNPVLKTKLQQQLALLERVLERVNEACVMF
jgi:hypothetical protein